MIAIVLLFPLFELSSNKCYGEFHQGVAPDRVSLECSNVVTTKHKPFKPEYGAVTVKVNDVIYRNCTWGSMDVYDVGFEYDSGLILTCP